METINLAAFASVNALTFDDSFSLFDNFRDVGQAFTLHKEYLTECFLAAFVLEGSAQIEVDDKAYEFQRGDLFVCTPRNILEKAMLSIDFDVRVIALTPAYVEWLANQINIGWSFRTLAADHRSIHADDDTLHRLMTYHELLRKHLQRPDFPNRSKLINTLVQAFALDFINIPEMTDNMKQVPVYTSAEQIFQRFARLLEDRQHPYVSVNEYASELNITPKYFSSVCKKVSGKTANQIIVEDIIAAAQILLRDNTKSIKQIADQLNFSNQSHFGTFFRHHVGCSPQQYRENLALE